MSKGSIIALIILGMFLGWNVFTALQSLLDYASSRAVVLQSELARAPELTEEVYQNARNVSIVQVDPNDYFMGFVRAIAAGLSVSGFILLCAQKRREE